MKSQRHSQSIPAHVHTVKDIHINDELETGWVRPRREAEFRKQVDRRFDTVIRFHMPPL